MDFKGDKILVLIYISMVLFRFIELLLEKRFLLAIFFYSFTPFFLYITLKYIEKQNVNFFRVYFLWFYDALFKKNGD